MVQSSIPRQTFAAVPPDLFGRRMPVAGRIGIEGDRISWSIGPSGWGNGAPALDALGAFLTLVRAGEGEMLTFMKEYGPLGIGADGRPLALEGSLPPMMKGTCQRGGAGHVESAAMWRAYSQHARDVIVLAGALRKGKRVDAERVLEPADQRQGPPPEFRWLGRAALVDNMENEIVPRPHHQTEHYQRRPRSLISQRRWLANHVSDTWVKYGGLRPRIVWDEETNRVELGLAVDYLSAWPECALFPVVALGIASSVVGPSESRLCTWPECDQVLPGATTRGRPRIYCDEHRREADLTRKREWAARSRGRS